MATFAAYGKAFLVLVIAAFLYYFFWISILPFMRIRNGVYAQTIYLPIYLDQFPAIRQPLTNSLDSNARL